jgi:plastocyanin
MRTHRVSLVACLAVCLLVSMAQGAVASGATVTQNNYFFSPGTVTVTTGSSLLIHNATPSTPHTFTISGHGIDTLTNGGQSASIVINLSPGTYPFFCRFHASLGMKGTLVVLSAPGSGPPGGSSAPLGGPLTGAGGTAHRPFPLLPFGIGLVLLTWGLLAMRRRRA